MLKNYTQCHKPRYVIERCHILGTYLVARLWEHGADCYVEARIRELLPRRLRLDFDIVVKEITRGLVTTITNV